MISRLERDSHNLLNKSDEREMTLYLHVDDAGKQLSLGVPLPAEALDFGGIFLDDIIRSCRDS